MSQVIRVPSDVYARLEQHAKGFDTPANVIEKLLNHFEGNTPISQPKKSVPVLSNERDKTKYQFNEQVYGKGRLVLAVVENYVSDHPDIDIDDLAIAFPKNLQGSIGVFNELGYVENKYAKKSHKRHFLKANEIIQLNGSEIVVCTEWGAGNIENVVQQAESLGYTVMPTNG